MMPETTTQIGQFKRILTSSNGDIFIWALKLIEWWPNSLSSRNQIMNSFRPTYNNVYSLKFDWVR